MQAIETVYYDDDWLAGEDWEAIDYWELTDDDRFDRMLVEAFERGELG